MVTSRVKEISLDLLDNLGIPHLTLSSQGEKGMFSLAKELILRDKRLFSEATKFRPHVMTGIGGIFVSHVGLLKGIPSVVFYDTENAVLQNLLTYPFATRVMVPECYQGWTLARNTTRYKGYHELAYLHPDYFRADKSIAIKSGLSETKDNYFVRLVSWQASHDVGEKGWNEELLKNLIDKLTPEANVMISSERELPAEFQQYSYKGAPQDVHHVLAYLKGFIGESATMASECAVLGVPSIYMANTGRGYTDEQESRYNLVKNVRDLTWTSLKATLPWLLEMSDEDRHASRQNILSDTIDVSQYIVETLEDVAI